MAKLKATKQDKKENIRSLEANGFYSDYEKNGMLYSKLIRSPAATGKVKSVTIPDLPEGYYIFTADNIPGLKEVELNKTKTRIFGYDNISYNGEPLAILAGPDEKTLEDLAEQVSVAFDIESLESALKEARNQRKRTVVELEPLDDKQTTDSGITDFVSQLNEMPSLDTVLDNKHNEQIVSKTIAQREVRTGLYSKMSVEEADSLLFENQKYISTETWSQDIISPKWQETNGAYCYTEGEKLHVYVPSKWTYYLQNTLSQVLNIPAKNIYIHKTKATGVYSNGLWRTTQIATQVALASYLSKKPVKLVLSQKEQRTYMQPGVKTEITYKVVIKEDGRIDTMNILIDVDVGCTNPFAQELLDRLSIAACNYYKPNNLYIKATARTSKNPPTSISLKGVDSQAFFAVENEMSAISRLTHIYPDELRLINSIPEKNVHFPFETEIADVSEIIQNTLKMSDFNRKYASFRMDAIDRVGSDSTPFFALPLRGVGLATGYITSGFWGSTQLTQDVQIEVTLTAEDKVIIHAIKPSDVVQEIWKKTAADIFQLPKQNIQIDSSYVLEDIPTVPEEIFSTIGLMNELLKKCCNDIQKKRFHQALPISSKRAITPAMKKVWDKENFSGNPYAAISSASTVVEVEVDTYTYSEKIKGIWITINCGELFDETAAIKTVRLEIQQELTMLVQGKTVTCDQVFINFIQSGNKSGQIGGLVHNTLPAAFSSALTLALATKLTHLPCTEQQLFKLIKDRESRMQIKKAVESENQAQEENPAEQKTESGENA